MTETDVYILEFLDSVQESGPIKGATPRTIHHYMEDPPTYPYLNRRMRTLVDAGLLEKPERGLYEISELGRRYLHDPDASIEEFLDEEDDEENGDDSADS